MLFVFSANWNRTCWKPLIYMFIALDLELVADMHTPRAPHATREVFTRPEAGQNEQQGAPSSLKNHTNPESPE